MAWLQTLLFPEDPDWIGHQYTLLFVKDDFKIVAVLRMRPQKPGPCVTAAWHDKDPTYKKQKAKLLQPLTDNGKVFIWTKNLLKIKLT